MILALLRRDVQTFLRDRMRLIGSLVQPLAFWGLLAVGLGPSFRPATGASAGVPYAAFLMPGIVTLVVVFTALFSTIHLVEERTEGFLQAALVAPASRASVALGLAIGGAALGLAQSLPFALGAPLLGLSVPALGWGMAVLHALLLGLAFTALGVTVAWRVATTRAYHAVMNGLMLPLWALSGAVFPFDTLPRGLALLVRLNPVAYSVEGLRAALLGESAAPPALSLAVAAAFCAAMLALAAATVRR